MKPVKLDLSKLKHIKSDDKTTTLQHKDGHQITILHSALSKDAQAQLGALKGLSKDAETPAQASEQKAQNTAANPVSRPDTGSGAITAIPGPAPKNGKVLIKEAEGGEIEKPKTEAPAEPAPGCSVVSTSKKYGNVILCNATGGEVNVADTQHVKFCPGCGGPLKLASGGGVPFADTALNSAGLDAAPTDDPESAPAPLSADEQNYNNRVMQNNEEDIEDPNTHAAQITAHGVRPKQLDTEAAHHVKVQGAWSANDKAASDKQTADAQAAQDQAAADLGLKTPGAPAPPPDLSGAGQEADASAQPPAMAKKPPTDPHDPESLYFNGMNESINAANASAAASAKQGETNAATYAKAQETQQQIVSDFHDQFNSLNKERLAHIQDIQNGHIDPNKYWTGDENGNGSHSKIASGIGMILAGFNPTTNPNAATEFLKNQMEQNLKAQERNLSSNETLLHANLQQFGNLKDATEMTRIMQHDTVANELAQAASVAQGPQAKAAALAAAGKFHMDASQMAQQFAMRRMMMGMVNSNGSSDTTQLENRIAGMNALGMPQGKTMSEAFVPGYGVTKSLSPVPKEIRDKLTTGNSLMNSIQDLQNYSTTHTNLNPLAADYKEGEAKAVLAQQRIREGLIGGVFKPADTPVLNKLLGENPAGLFKAVTTNPKLKAVFDSVAMDQDTVAQGANLPPKHRTLDQGHQGQPERKYNKQDGKWYTRGPDGKAIPAS